MLFDLRPYIHQLHPPLDRMASYALLEPVEHADWYLAAACVVLTCTIFIQLKAFARPPPVPFKKLPKRPILQILFKPDDISAQTTSQTQTTSEPEEPLLRNKSSGMMKSVTQSFLRSTGIGGGRGSKPSADAEIVLLDASTSPGSATGGSSWLGGGDASSSHYLTDDEDDASTPAELPFLHSHDLPDSFAPLLSSSQMEVLSNQLTTDLIHAVHVEGSIKLREGRHEIPLDKDNSRPQLVLDVPTKTGCRITAVAAVGSDGFSTKEDLNVSKSTMTRSKPMVKHAGLILDPPLPLDNVAPTLIHFPTLFEDNFVPTLRRIQIIRLAMDFVVSISSLIERVLWILERKCQIHLSKVRVTPLYKGSSSSSLPEWRLSLAFSGHLLLFGWIPLPFISVVLPTFIIPQPHALLEYLLTLQPLASAKLKREEIAEQRIALAALDTVAGWNVNVKAVATPPALGVDVTLPGGITLALEAMLGRDTSPSCVKRSSPHEEGYSPAGAAAGAVEQDSLSSWTTNPEEAAAAAANYLHNVTTTRRSGSMRVPNSAGSVRPPPPFDANTLVPWLMEVSAKGTVSSEKVSLTLLKFLLQHDDGGIDVLQKSKLSTAGSLAIWKGDGASPTTDNQGSVPQVGAVRKKHSSGIMPPHPRLDDATDSPSVCSMLLFPDEASYSSGHRRLGMLDYDYAFDVWEDTQLDAVTFSVGATHPMLKGGTMITTILESIYAFGSLTAREGANLDPLERQRKRNILRHLPAVDFTCGIQNAFIPPESMSYSDDGQTLCYPEMEGLRMVVRFIGGISGADASLSSRKSSSNNNDDKTIMSPVSDGIKLVADFAVATFSMNNATKVTEFPELDIFEGTKLLSQVSGAFTGRISGYLRPQNLSSSLETTGPNIFNPLEAYEIEFSGSSVSLKLKEYSATLGHRRVIVPTETTVVIQIVESVVDMSLDGTTTCELSWDFQGSSPILQVTPVGQSPAHATHENKTQVPLLIPALQQGRFQLNVSSVGGIAIQKAVTMRENKEGLYDWKFFNALVAPDDESADIILKVLHDKATMNKMLDVAMLVNSDLHRILKYALKQVWRAKEIFDAEGVSDPGKAIPGHKMARLISLFLCDDVNEVDSILPIIRGVTNGNGLDIVTVKDLLRRYVEAYDDWAPEIDRGVRWAAVMMGPIMVRPPYVENGVPPLSEVESHRKRFRRILSAKQLYDYLHDKPELPVDPSFSNFVGRAAPYMSYKQVEYILQVRSSTDWQPSDLRRLRYVYSIKKKVLDISESYGGLTFLPQSFLVSVFLGEATRATLRADTKDRKRRRRRNLKSTWSSTNSNKLSTLSALRRKRMRAPQHSSEWQQPDVPENAELDFVLTPAGRIASQQNFVDAKEYQEPINVIVEVDDGSAPHSLPSEEIDYQLGDSLLGPHDVAILLQAGLTSAMKSSTVVQLNQRMLLDLVASQPTGFAVAVLAEIGTPGGQGSPRALTHALMALLELDQSSFTEVHRLDMHALLESWLPGFKVPKREDYLAGGRWARQSYYEALYVIATSILEDAECYMALKGHIQRVRHHKETEPIPRPKESERKNSDVGFDIDDFAAASGSAVSSRLKQAIRDAQQQIEVADNYGTIVAEKLTKDPQRVRASDEFKSAVRSYEEAFHACARVLEMDKLAVQSEWFKTFFRRNYDALMIKSMYDNVVDDIDSVRHWFDALRRGSQWADEMSHQRNGDHQKLFDAHFGHVEASPPSSSPARRRNSRTPPSRRYGGDDMDDLFTNPDPKREQEMIDAILDAIIYEEDVRENLRKDPLIRMLIPNPEGKYNFTIVSAMGVITEGKQGTELKTAIKRMKELRGVETIRADTGTARSYEFNAAKIEEAIEAAQKLNRPYGLVGYSQGCANALMAESLLLSGTPLQQRALSNPNAKLICRQLLFSAANGSCHGPAVDTKVQRLIIMCEEFFKYQQGYFSRAFASTVLDSLNSFLDSAPFQKFAGGAQSMLPDGARAFWREAQHLPHITTCTLRGVLEDHTTPESLEMVSHLLAKQSGSALHDSQVHVYDAVGYPIYTKNRNGQVLANSSVGEGAIQRTHHWSPLSEEVEFVRTKRDVDQASFDCAKDRHIFPWVDVNARFGIIKYAKESDSEEKFANAHARALSAGRINMDE